MPETFPSPDPNKSYGPDHETAADAFKSSRELPGPAETDNSYDFMFSDEDTYSAHAPSVEAAAVRKQDLITLINGREEDDWGWKRFNTDPDANTAIAEGLGALGILADEPSKEELTSMRSAAVSRVEMGSDTEYLRNLPFKPIESFYEKAKGAKRSIVTWKGDAIGQENDLYIKPEAIEYGGGGFYNWSGDSGRTGKDRTTVAGESVQGTTHSAIREYAAVYDTQLPALEATALNVLVTDEVVECAVDHGIHRTAAAKLRGEPLRFSSMVFYDARGR